MLRNTLIALAIVVLAWLFIGSFLDDYRQRGSHKKLENRCLFNLQTISRLLSKYQEDHGGKFPPDLPSLAPYAEGQDWLFWCDLCSVHPTSTNQTIRLSETLTNIAVDGTNRLPKLSYLYIPPQTPTNQFFQEILILCPVCHPSVHVLLNNGIVQTFPSNEMQKVVAELQGRTIVYPHGGIVMPKGLETEGRSMEIKSSSRMVQKLDRDKTDGGIEQP